LNWYYARGDERMGPLDERQFGELLASGVVRDDTLVWREGMADWMPFGQIRQSVSVSTDTEELEPLYQDADLQPCAECGRPFPVEEMVSYENIRICGECKPVFFQRLRETGGMLGQMRYGGFWIRFAARFVDGLILSGINIPLMIVQQIFIGRFVRSIGPDASLLIAIFLFLGVWLFASVVAIVYSAYFVGRFAATPGKMIFGLKVLTSDGGKVSYGRAAGRELATFLSGIPMALGYIMAAFDREKRALHDHICDTRVVWK